MQVFYKSAQSDHSHVGGTEVVKGVLSSLRDAAANPRNILVWTLVKMMKP